MVETTKNVKGKNGSGSTTAFKSVEARSVVVRETLLSELEMMIREERLGAKLSDANSASHLWAALKLGRVKDRLVELIRSIEAENNECQRYVIDYGNDMQLKNFWLGRMVENDDIRKRLGIVDLPNFTSNDFVRKEYGSN